MAVHAEDSLRGPRISEILNLALAVSTTETGGTERLVPRKDSQVFDLVSASTAAVCAVVANERAIAEEKEVGIRVQQGAAGVASEAIEVPSVASY
jgi:hypothetical protein